MTSSPGNEHLQPEPGQEEDLLGSCPHCGYSLRGQPTVRPCPECGLPIDRRWRIFGGQGLLRGRGHWLNIGRLVLAVPGAYVVAVIFIFNCITPAMINSALARTLISAALAAALAMLIFIWMYRPKCFVALGPSGLLVYRHRRQQVPIPWSTIGRAEYQLGRKRIVVHFGDTKVKLDQLRFFANNMSEVDRCVQAINAYPRTTDLFDEGGAERPAQTPIHEVDR